MSAPYLLTASGQRYRLTGPELDAPRIGDIAHHLAQLSRFTGAASRPYSVAEHSLLCEHIAASEGAGPLARLCALMHDAHEAYTSDMSSPAKLACRMVRITHEARIDPAFKTFSDYDEFENLHHWHVLEAFGLNHASIAYAADIRRWDLIALATERRDLMPPDDGEDWEILRGVEPWGEAGVLLLDDVVTIHWASWRQIFLDNFERLQRMLPL